MFVEPAAVTSCNRYKKSPYSLYDWPVFHDIIRDLELKGGSTHVIELWWISQLINIDKSVID